MYKYELITFAAIMVKIGRTNPNISPQLKAEIFSDYCTKRGEMGHRVVAVNWGDYAADVVHSVLFEIPSHAAS